MDSYMKQQVQNSYDSVDSTSPGHDDDEPAKMEMPEPAALLDFKNQVKKWLEVDEQYKKLRKGSQECVVAKKALTSKILDFMARYNIEDLNTAAGKIRYKVALVKEPLSQNDIKEKVLQHFRETKNPEELNDRIFAARKTIPKPTLKRLPGPPAAVTAV